jgi:hypothetical protein
VLPCGRQQISLARLVPVWEFGEFRELGVGSWELLGVRWTVYLIPETRCLGSVRTRSEFSWRRIDRPMARLPRVAVPRLPHHVTQRSLRRQRT